MIILLSCSDFRLSSVFAKQGMWLD